mmetsp:Transcript_2541/g.6744  ORF Transcript_2541/g.6744 Transcript_2541/m.6744 type:complete len:283 (+) Transcript_2541:3-851(+)
MAEFWGKIQSPNDVYRSPSGLHVTQCLNVLDAAPISDGFFRHGGMCDPSPGYESYTAAVSQSRLSASDMSLHVPASSLAKGQPVWFSDQDPNIIDGILASGAIAPLVYPKEVSGSWYVDGGIFHNTPLLKALEEGATTVWVILLAPLQNASQVLVNISRTKDFKGPEIVGFYLDAVNEQMFLAGELREACHTYPHASIHAIVPNQTVGAVTDFYPEAIESMRRLGSANVDDAAAVDLCRVTGLAPDRIRNDGEMVYGLVLGALMGALGVMLGNVATKMFVAL